MFHFKVQGLCCWFVMPSKLIKLWFFDTFVLWSVRVQMYRQIPLLIVTSTQNSYLPAIFAQMSLKRSSYIFLHFIHVHLQSVNLALGYSNLVLTSLPLSRQQIALNNNKIKPPRTLLVSSTHSLLVSVIPAKFCWIEHSNLWGNNLVDT